MSEDELQPSFDVGTPYPETSDDLGELFSSLRQIRASDDLKARTLEAILSADGASMPATSHDEASVASALPAPLTESRPEPLLARRRAGQGSRGRVRALRILLVAVCIVLSVSTVAYATPVSHATISLEGASLVLDVNIFGTTIGAHSDDEEIQRAVDVSRLTNRPYVKSLDQAFTALESLGRDEQLEIAVDAQTSRQRVRLEEQTSRVLEEHEHAQQPGASVETQRSTSEPVAEEGASPQAEPDGLGHDPSGGLEGDGANPTASQGGPPARTDEGPATSQGPGDDALSSDEPGPESSTGPARQNTPPSKE